VNQPSPALVTQRAVTPAPRWALLLLCAAYVVPGVLGRAPWRNADISTVGVMAAMAQGRTSWLTPTLGGLPVDAAPLPHGLGALFIMALSPWIDPSTAARIPFALLLAAVLALTWYAAFYLARTEAAQPVAFAFGGEANHVDYARALGDSAVLALMASLGLLLLGHETTPELAQLASVALLLWGMAAAPFRGWQARVAVVAALPMLAASGAPIMALSLGATTAIIALRSQYAAVRGAALWIVGSTAASAVVGSMLGQWHWDLLAAFRITSLPGTAGTLAWFLWPSWLLAVWTLWRWRRQSLQRHIAVPLSIALVTLIACVVANGAQRTMLLGLPAFAVLAAFALPTLKRSTGAAIDWFSMFLFSAAAIFLWVVYVSLQTGVPPQPTANVSKLYLGYQSTFSLGLFALGAVATCAWLALVRWRTGRHRSALWKSLVLPASGVALSWLLVMTLHLPLADYVRSLTPWVAALKPHVPNGECIAAPGLPRAYVAALELQGGWRVDATPQALIGHGGCKSAIVITQDITTFVPPKGWRVVAQVRRPSGDKQELSLVLTRP
jgi:4-amino-4-deoxy-L-arabinose transferase-like glycosyltransferase